MHESMDLMKYPHMPLYTGDWLKDPLLAMCSAATRGIWIDLLCSMHELNRSGKITGSIEQFSRICRCSVDEMSNAIEELNITETARVTFGNGESNAKITIINRRMKRESKSRENNSKRQKNYKQKHNSNGENNGAITAISDNDNDNDIKEDNKEDGIGGLGEREDESTTLITRVYKYFVGEKNFMGQGLTPDIKKIIREALETINPDPEFWKPFCDNRLLDKKPKFRSGLKTFFLEDGYRRYEDEQPVTTNWDQDE